MSTFNIIRKALAQSPVVQNIILLIICSLVAVFFCWDALCAPFWGDNDTWAHLLPIVHYRQSILVEHTFPWHTYLWYGGYSQILNPLASFFYLPATLAFLALPLEIAIRLVILSHFIFSLYVGQKLAKIFLKKHFTSFAAAILLTSPMFPALLPAHFERILAWPWVLFGLYAFFQKNWSPSKRGLLMGFSLAIIALTGSNYYVFYTALLFGALSLSTPDLRQLTWTAIGALPGLIHLPSIWHLIGKPRAQIDFFDSQYLLTWPELFSSLLIGLVRPIEWEKLVIIGLPVGIIFAQLVYQFIIRKTSSQKNLPKAALFMLTILFSLLATGTLYQGHHLLDTFRVPSRAAAFVAVAMLLFILLEVETQQSAPQKRFNTFIFSLSLLQVFIFWHWIRPTGTQNAPEQAGELVKTLQVEKSQSVWFDLHQLSEMFIDVGLNTNNIALPNVYYGDMGQVIPVSGPYCGYSFDHLLIHQQPLPKVFDLHSNMTREVLAQIPSQKLSIVQSFEISGQLYDLYKVNCP